MITRQAGRQVAITVDTPTVMAPPSSPTATLLIWSRGGGFFMCHLLHPPTPPCYTTQIPTMLDTTKIFSELTSSTSAASGQYFPDKAVLQQIGFASVLDADIDIEASFSTTTPRCTGALVRTFTQDNTEDGYYIVYAIPLPTVASQGRATLHLHSGRQVWFTLRRLVFSLPWVGLLVFYVLAYVFPVLRYINMLATLVVICVYGYVTARSFLHALRIKKILRAGQPIFCDIPADAELITTERVEALLPLLDEGIRVAVLSQHTLYLRLDIHAGIFMEKLLDQGTIQASMQRILRHLQSPAMAVWYT